MNKNIAHGPLAYQKKKGSGPEAATANTFEARDIRLKARGP
jgi:hypothetical protein